MKIFIGLLTLQLLDYGSMLWCWTELSKKVWFFCK